MALKQEPSKGLLNNDCPQSLNDRPGAALPPALFSHFHLALPSWVRPCISYMRHTTHVTSYIWFFVCLFSSPWKGQHTGKSSALKERVGSAQDTAPFTGSVAWEQNRSAGHVWTEGGVFHPLPFRIWVPLLLSRYSCCNPTKGWHRATCDGFGWGSSTGIRGYEWADPMPVKWLVLSVVLLSDAFEMQRTITWTDTNRNSSSCPARLWYSIKQPPLRGRGQEMGTSGLSQTPDSVGWRWCAKHLREQSQDALPPLLPRVPRRRTDSPKVETGCYAWVKELPSHTFVQGNWTLCTIREQIKLNLTHQRDVSLQISHRDRNHSVRCELG